MRLDDLPIDTLTGGQINRVTVVVILVGLTGCPTIVLTNLRLCSCQLLVCGTCSAAQKNDLLNRPQVSLQHPQYLCGSGHQSLLHQAGSRAAIPKAVQADNDVKFTIFRKRIVLIFA